MAHDTAPGDMDNDPPSYNVNTSDYRINAARGLKDVLGTGTDPSSAAASHAGAEMLANPPDYLRPDQGPGMNAYDANAQARARLAKQLPGIQLGSPFGALFSTGAQLAGDDDAQAAEWGMFGAGLEGGLSPLAADRMGFRSIEPAAEAKTGTLWEYRAPLNAPALDIGLKPPTGKGLAPPFAADPAPGSGLAPSAIPAARVPGASAPTLTKADFPDVSRQISQKQYRHIFGHPDWMLEKGGYLSDIDAARNVLDAYHSGEADIIGKSPSGFPIVKLDRVTGFNNNKKAGYADQPTSIFMIKGTSKPSIVPVSPGKEKAP
mgnify:FL=1